MPNVGDALLELEASASVPLVCGLRVLTSLSIIPGKCKSSRLERLERLFQSFAVLLRMTVTMFSLTLGGMTSAVMHSTSCQSGRKARGLPSILMTFPLSFMIRISLKLPFISVRYRLLLKRVSEWLTKGIKAPGVVLFVRKDCSKSKWCCCSGWGLVVVDLSPGF